MFQQYYHPRNGNISDWSGFFFFYLKFLLNFRIVPILQCWTLFFSWNCVIELSYIFRDEWTLKIIFIWILFCLSRLSVSSVCLVCLFRLSVSSVHLVCLSRLSVSSVCLSLLSRLSVSSVRVSVCLVCLSRLSVSSVCLSTWKTEFLDWALL